MILTPLFIVFVSVVTSVTLIYQLRNRNSLATRLKHMVPGSGLETSRIKAQKRRLSRVSKATRRQIDDELPDLIDLACSAVLTGHSLHSAIERIVSRANGRVSDELKTFLRNVELGRTVSSELAALCERNPTPAMKEFVNKISIAISRGTPLSDSFLSLSEALRVRRSNSRLARAGSNETKMLIPLVALVLPTTVIFALYPSVLVLNEGFN